MPTTTITLVPLATQDLLISMVRIWGLVVMLLIQDVLKNQLVEQEMMEQTAILPSLIPTDGQALKVEVHMVDAAMTLPRTSCQYHE